MSQRVTKCTVCGQPGHTRLHCLVMCGVCSGDSRKCDCEPPAKKQKGGKKNSKKTTTNQPSQPRPIAASSPEVNYKSLCRQLKQKNEQLGKAYQDLKDQYDQLQQTCEEKEAELEQSQQDAEEMASFVRSAEGKVSEYKKRVREQHEEIGRLQRQLQELQNRGTPQADREDEATCAKVDRNDLQEIHRRYSAVLSVLCTRKCSLNNAYRLAKTARSTIRDFIGIAELRIVNEQTYHSTLEMMSDPKLSVRTIEAECRKQLGGLLPYIHRLRTAKKLLPLAVDDSFYS